MLSSDLQITVLLTSLLRNMIETVNASITQCKILSLFFVNNVFVSIAIMLINDYSSEFLMSDFAQGASSYGH